MKLSKFTLWIILLSFSFSAYSQEKIVITGARFTYPLFEKWINGYRESHPQTEVSILPRGGSQSENLANAVIYGQLPAEKDRKPDFEYVLLTHYAVIPVANANSEFAKVYSSKGLDEKILKKVFFEDVFAENDKKSTIEFPYTVYTRQQKADLPTIFAKTFGFQQDVIKGVNISGADIHLIDAVLKDNQGVSYNHLGFIYDLKTKKPLEGLVPIPIDLSGNGKVEDKEREAFTSLDILLQYLQSEKIKDFPLGDIYLGFPKNSPQIQEFVNWIQTKGLVYSSELGFVGLHQKEIHVK
jgi:ABC-type phosphate transport system substrate-binding protein